jgi:cytochrome c peroxidase
MPRIVLAVALLLTLVVACGRSRSLSSGGTSKGPTPLELRIPAWAIDTTGEHPFSLPYDNPTTVEGVALGRRLFHDPILSHDGRTSCASCHRRELAFSDPRNFPDERGYPRNSMPLINLAQDHYFFWDARALGLELQAFEPVRAHTEMNSDWPSVVARLETTPHYPALFQAAFGTPGIDSLRVAYALAQFERTLISYGSRWDRWRYGGDITALDAQELRGWRIFTTKGHCADCHMPPRFTDSRVVGIGLDSDPADKGLGARTGIPWHHGRFKTPTLRNIAVTAPYMHDGRFATLEEVLAFYASGVRTDAPNLDVHMQPWMRGEVLLSARDKADLLAFLHCLTDEAFLTDPASGPLE